MRRKLISQVEGYIAKEGKTSYVIVADIAGDCALQYAAEELQRLIKLAANVEIAIQSTSAGKNAIYLASGKALTKDCKNRNGFVIKTEGKDVYIDGVDKTGLLFGVYRFMEYVADYMYLNDDETLIGDSVAFKELDIYDYPDFANRDIYCVDTKNNPAHARRLFASGGTYSYQEEKYGEGSWWSTLHDQSLCDQLVEHKVYRQKYPHWYSSKDGAQFQLCYTEALYSKDEYEKGNFSEENYDDGRHGLFWTLVYNLITKYIMVEKDKELFQLGMNDNVVFCDCPRCSEDKEKYGQSGVCIRFVNAVADEVEKWRLANCPERKIYLTFFAYYAIFDAPVKEVDGELVPMDDSVIVRDNVIVRYTPMDGYYMFPLDDKEHNPQCANAFEGWAKVAKNFSVWDYRIDFYSYISPFCQYMGAKDTMLAYKRYNFMDVMYQGCSSTTSTPFLGLDNFVRARFSWDTSQDYDKLTEYYIDNYFQLGANCIKKYREILTENYKKIFKELGYKGHSHHGVTRRYYFSFEVIQNIEKAFMEGYAEILKIKESEPERYKKLKLRLDRESLFYRFMKVAFYPEHYSNDERREEISNFEVIARKVNFKYVCNSYEGTDYVIHILRMPLEDRIGQIDYGRKYE